MENFKIPFWKYKDKTLEEVAKVDVNYIHFLYEKEATKPRLNQDLVWELMVIIEKHPLPKIDFMPYWKYQWQKISEVERINSWYLSYILNKEKFSTYFKNYALILAIEEAKKSKARMFLKR